MSWSVSGIWDASGKFVNWGTSAKYATSRASVSFVFQLNGTYIAKRIQNRDQNGSCWGSLLQCLDWMLCLRKRVIGIAVSKATPDDIIESCDNIVRGASKWLAEIFGFGTLRWPLSATKPNTTMSNDIKSLITPSRFCKRSPHVKAIHGLKRQSWRRQVRYEQHSGCTLQKWLSWSPPSQEGEHSWRTWQ